MIVLLMLLLALGSACLFFAPAIQKAGLRMMGQPRNRLAGWCGRLAGSRTSLLGIRASGAMCIAFAAAVFVFALAK